MSYIRVTDYETKLKVDLNSNHVVAFAAHAEGGTLISLVNGVTYRVSDTPRSVRGFVFKAQNLNELVPQSSD